MYRRLQPGSQNTTNCLAAHSVNTHSLQCTVGSAVQSSAEEWFAVQWSTAHYSAAQCNTVQWSAVQWSRVECSVTKQPPWLSVSTLDRDTAACHCTGQGHRLPLDWHWTVTGHRRALDWHWTGRGHRLALDWHWTDTCQGHRLALDWHWTRILPITGQGHRLCLDWHWTGTKTVTLLMCNHTLQQGPTLHNVDITRQNCTKLHWSSLKNVLHYYTPLHNPAQPCTTLRNTAQY